MGAHLGGVARAKIYEPDKHIDRKLFDPRKREREQGSHDHLKKQEAHKNGEQTSADIALNIVRNIPEYFHRVVASSIGERPVAPSVTIV